MDKRLQVNDTIIIRNESNEWNVQISVSFTTQCPSRHDKANMAYQHYIMHLGTLYFKWNYVIYRCLVRKKLLSFVTDTLSNFYEF